MPRPASTCCYVCHLPKKGNRDKFYAAKKTRDGLAGACKKCILEKAREYNKRPERITQNRENSYLRKYGLTIDDYDQLLDSQDGQCAICESKDPGSEGCFHVDHCHTTGAIRGLLCHNCNAMLGHSKDSVKTLRIAIKYLER